MSPVLLLFMVMAFAEILEKEWIKSDLNMVNLRQHTHSPCDVGKLTGHNKKIFEQGKPLALFCVLYVDDCAFTFEERDQLTRGLNLIYHHFTRFGLEIHVGKGKKSPKTECVFFPPPGFLGRKFSLPAKNSRGKRRMSITNTRQESYEERHRREEIACDKFPKTRLIVVKGRFVTFC